MKTKPSTLTKAEVLLIASDSVMQQSVRTALEAENYQVLSADSLNESHEFPNAGSIDILVLEVDHETERLVALLAQFKAQRPQVRTIGIRRAQNGAARASLSGVNVWMDKPSSPTWLVTTVNNLLAELRSEIFRDEMLRRQTAPLFSSVPFRRWGQNE
jgi:DNA-binding NtrC family response regulator